MPGTKPKRKKAARPRDLRTLRGKTILVTGGAGFIGSNFIRYVLGRYEDIRVINLDKLTYAGNLDNLADIAGDPRYEFVRGDIRDAAVVAGILGRVQGVAHFAAETHVDRSILSGGEFVLTDVHGTYTLLEAVRNAPGIEFFLHVSTDEVYGSRDAGFFKETAALNPSSPYSASKVGADRLAHAFHVTYGTPALIVRPSNNYGPYQYPEKFIPLFTTNAMEDQALPLYGKGRNVRDWLHVEDNCRAIETVILRGETGQAYNVGANDERFNIDVAKRILKLLGKPVDLIKFVPDRLGHDRRYAVDCRKLKALGWKREVDFEAGLEETVRWYVENRNWWLKIKTKSAEYKAFIEKNYGVRS
ncbi:MAG: dTDP-glucose 4,6-dehydratase [Acidobacteriota bacterium]|nr:dTDP-glucose 4,6-dehydratase [Acidobacteriota bacterium]